MLTPRMPLYIPCVYVVFMYTSAVGAWRIGNKRFDNISHYWVNSVILNVTPYFHDISSALFASYFSSGFKVWSFGAAATAALAGLMGEMIYSPYDITGIFH